MKLSIFAFLQHAFTINFADASALPWSSDSLTLCFDDPTTAEEWRKAIEKCILTLRLHVNSAASRRRREFSKQGSDAAAVMATLPEGERLLSEENAPEGSSEPDSEPVVSRAPATHRSWQSVHHINGVAVYAEEEGDDGEGSAVMASVVVRAPPRSCFHALMQITSSAPGAIGEIPFTDSVTLLETIDAHTQVVRHQWLPGRGLGRWLVAPRDFVALRTWRQEPDGTYIVLYQSTTHRKARNEKNGWGAWVGGPVRAKVQAAGFTISPLLPQYVPGGGPSQECLVTLVIKADLSGSLSPTSWLSRLAPVVADAARWRLMEPLLMSVVALRDRVEQRRFVVIPYTMAAQGDDDALLPGETYEDGTKEMLSLPASPALTPRFQRTTTAITEQSLTPKPSPLGTASTAGVMPSPRSRLSLPPVAEDVSDQGADGEIFKDALPLPSSTAQPISPFESSRKKEAKDQAPTASTSALAAPEDELWAVQGTTLKKYWSFPGASYLRIRGPLYLIDRVKVPAAPPMLDLYASDLVDGDEPLWNIAASLPSMKYCPAPFAFVLNLIYPANGMLQSLVTTWTAPVDVSAMDEEDLIARWGDDPEGTVRSFFRNFKPWMEGDGPEADKRRNIKFKLIPRVAEGSWVVRQSVGTTPVLLGLKLKTKYFKGKAPGGCSYFECDVDITSNTVANSVTRLVVNSITSLVVDLAPLVEGQASDELPERVIGSVRYDHLDLTTATIWDEDKGMVERRPT